MKYLSNKIKKLHHNNRGDTIVEVLIVLGILSFAFALSSATATKGLRQSRSAEEHSQALGVLNSQIELLRAGVSNRLDLFSPSPFCVLNSSSVATGFSAGYTIPDSADSDDFTKYPANCAQNTLYYTSVSYNGSDTFTIRVRWDGAGDLGRQQEVMTYRVHPLTAVIDSGIPLSAASPKVKVSVKKIPSVAKASPDTGGNTPPCSNSATLDKSGTTVTLNQVNGAGTYSQAVLTNGSSIALFDNLTDGGSYKATVTAPSGYGVCPANPSGPVTAVGGTLPTITMTIYPICADEDKHDSLGTYGDPVYDGTYGDQIYDGTYGDPYNVYWWQHTGNGWYSSAQSPVYGTANTSNNHGAVAPAPTADGQTSYENIGANPKTSGTHNGQYDYNVFTSTHSVAYGAAYAHYHTGPAYAHYHTGPAYEHFGPWYKNGVCTP